MKKFLSLVLALVMTMSLVTIGAGATEYKDLTDKSEIQYEEAVAVLNKLGIVTGYEDGSFKPTGALTRGAAAKIIVSLMIGSEAASKLSVAAAPYKDVPATNTFAAVISYCKTAGYINGYTDGTFRPTGALTGYAFTKMLLGALGYDGVQEGFTGSGWTMNVAKLGNTAGLFNDFTTTFSGNTGVTREGACLLALNTLKATEVQYAGGTNITTTTGNATTNVSTQKERSYVTSNNTKINKNISDKKLGDSSNDYPTLEFGEEHFTDLKLSQTTQRDDFGRPSNQWSYKSVTVGTYAKAADYTYTTGASGDTVNDKLKNMDIKDLKTTNPSNVESCALYVNGALSGSMIALKDIPGQTGDGVQVELYMNETNADQISTVVVINTQIMQVKKVSSSAVTLKKADDSTASTANGGKGFFQPVTDVKDGDDCFKALSTLKADDYVLVVPAKDGSNYKVASVVIPQVVTGALTSIKIDGAKVKNLTVAGTTYKMSANFGSKDNKLTSSTTPNKNSNTTVYLDTYGFAIFAKDVENSSSYMVYDETYSNIVNGKVVYYAQGWDMDGKAVSLNMGTNSHVNDGMVAGQVYEYTTDGTTNNAEYAWDAGANISGLKTTAATAGDPVGMIASTKLDNGVKSLSLNAKTYYFASDVNFIYVTRDGSDATGVIVKTGIQKLTRDNTYYFAILGTDADAVNGYTIDHIVVFDDNDLDIGSDVLFITSGKVTTLNASGDKVTVFDGFTQDGTAISGAEASKYYASAAGKFYTYSKNETTGVYTLSEYQNYTDKATSVLNESTIKLSDLRGAVDNKNYISAANVNTLFAQGTPNSTLNFSNAVFVDDTAKGTNFNSLDDILSTDFTKVDNGQFSADPYLSIAVIYNDGDNATQGKVLTVYVTGISNTL